MLSLEAGGVWAKLVLVAERVFSVENSVTAGGKGVPEIELLGSASIASVGRDSRVALIL